ncbi:MAG: four helix bundle protein [Lachnospiraceae bacterium]|nr:four helix bundle protein [Lachnospiraceae bacterium]
MDTRRGTTKNYGGSFEVPLDIGPEGYTPKTFVMKEKIGDMMKYALPLLDKFPRRSMKLADTLRNSLIETYRLAIYVERGISRKTNLQKIDAEIATIKEFVIIASDRDYYGEKFAPPLTIHERETWAKMNDEIGRLVGGYIRALDAQTKNKK